MSKGFWARALFASAFLLTGGARAEPQDLPRVPSTVAPPLVPPAERTPGATALTLDDALRIFRARSFDLVIAEAAVASAEGDVLAARALPNPNVQFEYSHIFNYRADGRNLVLGTCVGCASNGILAQISDNAALENVLSGKLSLKRAVAQAALAAQKMQRRDARRLLEGQVKNAYVAQAAAAAALRYAREAQGFSAKLLELSRIRHPAVINDGQLALVVADKAQADIAVIQSEGSLEESRAVLALLLGVQRIDVIYDADVRTAYRLPPELANLDARQLVDLALAERPDLAALRLSVRRARASSALVDRQAFPDVALMMQYYDVGTAQNAVQPPTLTWGASLNLPLFYQLQGEKRRAQADIDTQSALANKAIAQVVSDVRTALAAFDVARRSVDILETTQLVAARRARDVAETQWREGSATLLDVLYAQRQLIATNQTYVAALQTYWSAIFALEQAVGIDGRTP
ncbi:TolC family protein [Labilithrix luteola]|nr:TolC family protein [Labilithrix luteola]